MGYLTLKLVGSSHISDMFYECKNCGCRRILSSYNYCPDCGGLLSFSGDKINAILLGQDELNAFWYKCVDCGCDLVLLSFKFCPNCGKKLIGKYELQNNYHKKIGLVAKTYKLDKRLVEAFAEACRLKGVSQARQLSLLMQDFIMQAGLSFDSEPSKKFDNDD